MNTKKYNKGFTLVELLATIVIIGIITGIVIVIFNVNLQSTKDDAEEVFVDTIRTTLDVYLASGAKQLVFEPEEDDSGNRCYLQKKHGNIYMYSQTTDLASVIYGTAGSGYNTLNEKDLVNPANKDVSCGNASSIPVTIYRDDDYVYYYYIDKDKLADSGGESCLLNNDEKIKETLSDGTIIMYSNEITNLPENYVCENSGGIRDGFLNLSKYSDTSVYGNNSKSFNIFSHHGGIVTINKDNEDVSISRSGDTVTIGNLNSLDAGTIVNITVNIGETAEYNSISKLYKLTITKNPNCRCIISSVSSVGYPNNSNGTINYNCTGDGVVNVSSSNPDAYRINSVSGNSASFSAVSVGSSTLTVSQSEGTNYTSCSNASRSLSVDPSVFTVKFNCGVGSGTAPSNQTVQFGKNISITSDSGECSKIGYKFNKWADPTGNKSWTGWSGSWNFENGQYGISDNVLNLTAQWAAIPYSLVLDAEGGQIPSASGYSVVNGHETVNKAMTYNTLYGDLPMPTREGYKFVGWYNTIKPVSFSLSAPGGNNWYYKEVVSDIYPGVTYTIDIGSVVLNSGSASKFTTYIYDFTDSKILAERTTDFGNNISYSIVAPSDANPNHNIKLLMYSGLGGSTSGNSTTFTNVKIGTTGTTIDTKYLASNNMETLSNHVLYARWLDAMPPNISVVNKVNGNNYSGGFTTGTITSTITFFDNGDSEINPNSLQWKCINTNTSWTNISNSSTSSKIETWSADRNDICYYKICDNADNCNITSGFEIKIDNNPPVIGTVDVKNITFSGYDVYVYGVNDISSVTKVQFPTWTQINGQDDIGGDWWNSSLTAGTNMGNGTWYYRVNVSDHNNEYGKYNTHIYAYDQNGFNSAAGWNDIDVPAITVTYDGNGYTGAVPESQSKKYGVDITLSSTSLSRTGYTFLGWNTDKNATSAMYSPGQTYSTNVSVTLYAIWRANTYTVNFDANGGTLSTTSKTVTYDSAYGDLPTPTKDLHKFVGWFTGNALYDSTKLYKDYPWLYYADTNSDLYSIYGYNQLSLRNHYKSSGQSEGRRKSQYLNTDIYKIDGNQTLYAGYNYYISEDFSDATTPGLTLETPIEEDSGVQFKFSVADGLFKTNNSSTGDGAFETSTVDIYGYIKFTPTNDCTLSFQHGVNSPAFGKIGWRVKLEGPSGMLYTVYDQDGSNWFTHGSVSTKTWSVNLTGGVTYRISANLWYPSTYDETYAYIDNIVIE